MSSPKHVNVFEKISYITLTKQLHISWYCTIWQCRFVSNYINDYYSWEILNYANKVALKFAIKSDVCIFDVTDRNWSYKYPRRFLQKVCLCKWPSSLPYLIINRELGFRNGVLHYIYFLPDNDNRGWELFWRETWYIIYYQKVIRLSIKTNRSWISSIIGT